ncbi:MAG: 2,3-bisphosphoglycerate-independent phosphoglycerate mutase, partial [Proteobacteria bacterium]|nr:2,3-bisphosphoglycerate-independent phosphoglycerate mutase [Pseudomonadota bacterium]
MIPKRPKPVVLCILDGWGERPAAPDNAIALARTPVWDRLIATCPHSRLNASELEVGLPEGQFGNSEVGHMNIGAGRVVLQELPKIDTAIAVGSLAGNEGLRNLIGALRKSGCVCHLLGLLSPGGVHSHQDHMAALARIVAGAGVPVRVHAFLDGRDTPPKSAAQHIRKFEADIAGLTDVSIATVSGRYYALDRDNRWERVAKAVVALRDGTGAAAPTAMAALDATYAGGKTDEFMLPAVIDGYVGMRDGDGLLMANFRSDRAREILAALAAPDFDGYDRGRVVSFAARLGMVEYSAKHAAYLDAMFPPRTLSGILGEVVAEAGLKQLRIAETEKYAHVTFFLNGGREAVFPGEERIMVPSPKVATYDLQPEMAAPEVTDRLVAAIEAMAFDLIVVNYANGDMVGHTGVLEAAIKAAETIDACLGRLEAAVARTGG